MKVKSEHAPVTIELASFEAFWLRNILQSSTSYGKKGFADELVGKLSPFVDPYPGRPNDD